MLTSSLATARSRWRGVSKFAPWDGISVPGAAIGRLNRRRGKQASADRRWPLANPDEGTLTRTRGGAQAQTGAGDVIRVGRRSGGKAAQSGASGRARLLLKAGKAAVLRRYPFTLILKTVVPAAQPASLRLKIDPGAKTTGLALVHDTTGQVVWACGARRIGASRSRNASISAAPVGARGASATPATARRASPTAGGGRAGCRPRWRVVSPMCSPGWSGCDVGVPSALSAWNSSSSIPSSCRTLRSVGWSINRGLWQGTRSRSICSRSGGGAAPTVAQPTDRCKLSILCRGCGMARIACPTSPSPVRTAMTPRASARRRSLGIPRSRRWQSSRYVTRQR